MKTYNIIGFTLWGVGIALAAYWFTWKLVLAIMLITLGNDMYERKDVK